MMSSTLEYSALNLAVLDAVPQTARRILDLGCGTGTLGRAIKARQETEVIGITYSPRECDEAIIHLDKVLVSDLNSFIPDDLGCFDCIICSHVLEHLYWPESLLQKLRPMLDPRGRLVVALPNILAWRQRVRFFRGQFQYTNGGLMDRTHFRFYDWLTARALVTGAGFQEVSAYADGVFPLARFVPGLGRRLSRVALRVAPGLFGWQFVIVAEPMSEQLS